MRKIFPALVSLGLAGAPDASGQAARLPAPVVEIPAIAAPVSEAAAASLESLAPVPLEPVLSPLPVLSPEDPARPAPTLASQDDRALEDAIQSLPRAAQEEVLALRDGVESLEELERRGSAPDALYGEEAALFDHARPGRGFIGPREPGELSFEGSSDPGVRVKTARVAYADHGLIREDFPEVAHLSDQQLDGWLLASFAYVSVEQLKLQGIRNGEISVDPADTKRIYRPHGYGRAGVLEAVWEGRTVGLADGKGLGLREGRAEDQVRRFGQARHDPQALRTLQSKHHSNGLASLTETAREASVAAAAGVLAYEHQKDHGTEHASIRTYAIIDYGFDLLWPDGVREPAGLYLRQAHWDRLPGLDVPKELGVSPYAKSIQGDGLDRIVDMGNITISDSRLRDRFIGWDPAGRTDPQRSWSWQKAKQAAQAFRAGESGALFDYIGYMLEPVRELWRESQDRRNSGKKDALRRELLGRFSRPLIPLDPALGQARAYLDAIADRLGPDARFIQVLLMRMLPANRDLFLRNLAAGQRSRLAEALNAGAYRVPFPVYRFLYADSDPAVRKWTVTALRPRRTEEAESFSLVLEALRDPDPGVARAAADLVLGGVKGVHTRGATLAAVVSAVKSGNPSSARLVDLLRQATRWADLKGVSGTVEARGALRDLGLEP